MNLPAAIADTRMLENRCTGVEYSKILPMFELVCRYSTYVGIIAQVWICFRNVALSSSTYISTFKTVSDVRYVQITTVLSHVKY